MTRTIILWLSFLCFPFLLRSQDDNCGLDNRWELQPNSGIQTFTIDVSDYTNNRLDDPNQGLCRVELGFAHNAVKDLEIWLESPQGQRIQLIGPNVDGDLVGIGANWQITFIPSTEPAAPMPGGYAERWTNDQNVSFTITGTGSYYPYDGDLEDFTTGDVNGIWTVEVRTDPTAASFNPVGIIYNFRLIFCDESGVLCCFADAGVLDGVDDFSACENDPSLDLPVPEVDYIFSVRPDSTEYDYAFCIVQDGLIVDVVDDPDLRGYPAGDYQIFGLSYRSSDQATVDGLASGALSLIDLRTDLESETPSFCGDLTAEPINIQIVAPEIILPDPEPLTCTRQEVTLDASASLPSGLGAFEWRDATGTVLGTDSVLTVDSAGRYELVLSLFGGSCSVSEVVEVTEDRLAPVADAGSDATLTCDDPSLVPGGAGTSNGPDFVYAWTTTDGRFAGPSDVAEPTVDAPGTYVLEVTDTTNGCRTQDEVVIDENKVTPVADAGADATLTCDQTSLVLGGPATSQGVDYQYRWSTTNGSFTTADDIPQPEVDAPGTYTLLVTDTRNGCTDRDEVTINENTAPPVADAGPVDELTCAQTTVTLGGPNLSEGPDFRYQWMSSDGNFSSAADIARPTVDAPGTYELLVTDTRNGCTATGQVIIGENLTPPTADAGSDQVLTCADPELTAGGNGTAQGPDYTYRWTTTNGRFSAATDTRTTRVDAAGDYVLEVTDTRNGCTATDALVITDEQELPRIDLDQAPVLTCENPSLQLDTGNSDSGPAFTYQWTSTNGNILSGAGTATPLVDQPGDYQLRIENTGTGCVNTGTLTVNADFNPPLVRIADPDYLNCEVTSVTFDASASDSGSDYRIAWRTLTGGSDLSAATTLTPVVSSTGTYELVITDTRNGCRDSAQVTVRDTLNTILADPGAGIELTCANPTATLDGSGSSTGADIVYEWSTSDGQIDSDPTAAAITVSAPGTYQLLVRDTFTRCSATGTVTVSSDLDLPVAEAGPGRTLTCELDQLTLNGSGTGGGNLIYQWTGPCLVSGSDTPAPVVNCPGTYYLTVENADNGCTAIDSVVVSEDREPPTVLIAAPDTLTCRQTSVTLDAGASSSGAAFRYTWTGPGLVSGVATLQPVVDAPGLYTLEITDTDNGCTAAAGVTVESRTSLPAADAGPDQTIDCNNPSLVLGGGNTASGPQITYRWTSIDGVITDPFDEPQMRITIPGKYILEVTDAQSGCTGRDTVEVYLDREAPVADAGPDRELNCSVRTLTLNGSNSSPAPGGDILYEWSGDCLLTAADRPTVQIDCADVYYLRITNQRNGCVGVDSVRVTEDQEGPNAVLADTAYIDCVTGLARLDGSRSSGGTFSWLREGAPTGRTDAVIEVAETGTYELIVTNNTLGCTDTAQIQVILDCTPVAAIASPDTINCRQDLIRLDAGGSSTGPQYEYQWITDAPECLVDGAETLFPRLRCGGAFTLIVRNPSVNLSDTASVTVVMDTLTPRATAGVDGRITCNEPEVALDGSGSASGPGYQYFWSDFLGDTISNDLTATAVRSGAYILEVVDQRNGCRGVDFVVVEQDAAVPDIRFGNDVIPCQEDELRLEASVEPAGADYAYQWSGPGIIADEDTPAVLLNEPGTYELVVTNRDNGCVGRNAVIVTEEGCGPCVDLLPVDTITCSNDAVRLGAQFCDDCSGCTIEWQTDDGLILEGANTLTPLVGAAGSYELRVANPAGFVTVEQVSVVENIQSPFVSAGFDRFITCDESSLVLEPTGGTLPSGYEYQWRDTLNNPLAPAGTTSLLVDQPGHYVLEVTDLNNGCRAADTVEVGLDTLAPSADAGPVKTLTCDPEFVVLDGSASSLGPDISYVWSAAPGGNILSGSDTPNPTVGASGLYSLTVTNTRNGCFAVDSVRVEQEDALPPLPPLTDSNLTCVSPVLTLDGASPGNGAYSYEWCRLDSGGDPVDCRPEPVITIDRPGRYRLEITDVNTGCRSTLTIRIGEELGIPQVEAGENRQLGCGADGIRLQGSAGPAGTSLSYRWTHGDGAFIEAATSLTPTVYASGIYQLLVTDDNSGCTAVDSLVITQDENMPEVQISEPLSLTCLRNQVQLAARAATVSGDVRFQWQNAEGGIVSGATGPTPLVNRPGLYELRVTDPANDCSVLVAVEVTADREAPVAAIANEGDLLLDCRNEQLILDGRLSEELSDASLLYSWRVLNGAPITGNPSDAQVGVSSPGLYRLVVTDMDNGCRDTLDLTVRRDPLLPDVVIAPPEVITCSRPEVTLNGGASSAGPGYRSTWRDDAGEVLATGQLNLTVTEAGTYELLIASESNGCIDSAQVLVTADTLKPVARIAPPEALDCLVREVELNGAASSSGGEITYNWLFGPGNIISGQNSAVALTNTPGQYTLRVRNTQNGCFDVSSVTVEERTTPIDTARVRVEAPRCDGSATGTIRIDSIQGGAGPFLYALNDDFFVSQPAFTDLQPGVYQVRIQDSNGCEWSSSVEIPDANTLEVNLGPDRLINLGDTVFLEAGIRGGSYESLTWSPLDSGMVQGKPQQLLRPHQTTTYRVTVEAQGCVSTDFITITIAKRRTIFVPTAFSPNGDGNNDRFYLQTGPDVQRIKSFQIFDRWGTLVYSAGPFPPNDPSLGWDGTYQGRLLNPAVFVFFAEVEFIDGWVETVKGDVALMR